MYPPRKVLAPLPPAAEDDRYLQLPELARYAGLSYHTLRRHLTAKERPLPHYRIGGRLLVKKSEYDRWAAGVSGAGETSEPKKHAAVDKRIVAGIVNSIRKTET
jgi:excisionase family DNA binding protein